MSTRVVDRVDDWDERSFTGGYRELHELADDEFSGVVRAGGAELYMTKGVVVGIRQGDVDDFEDGRGTVYEAPSPALPLLAIMQERSGDDARDQFYTEKTAISEVDDTLSDGGFTGYIELSENVLSGDYYLVYQAGRSMSVGFVGESARLIDSDEAFETADDEVGIYKVYDVDIDPIEIPEPAGSGSTGGSGSTEGSGPSAEQPATGAAGSERADADTTEPTEPGGTEPSGGATQDAAAGTADAQRPETDPTGETGAGSGATGSESEAASGQRQSGQQRRRRDADREPGSEGTRQESGREQDAGDERAEQHTDRTEESSRERQRQQIEGAEQERGEETAPAPEYRESDGTPAAREQPTEQQERGTPDPGTQQRPAADQTGTGQADWDRDAARDRAPAEGGRSAGDDGGLDLEQRAIPSLDPDRTAESDASTAGSARDSLERSRGQTTQPGGQEVDRGRSERGGRPPRERQSGASAGAQQGETGQRRQETTQQPQAAGKQRETTPSVDPGRVEELEAEVDEREAEIDRLETELSSATDERDDLREQLESVREERDELQSEVERLEEELGRLEEELGAATDAERRITSDEALSGTDIFVRYHSKGDATLEKAHGGSTRKEDVNDNLRLEKHTQFDADTVAVGGQSYAEYLEGTVEYQFVEWLVRELLFEIRETGHQKELKDLYDVLAAVDRAELAGVVDVVYTADGQETRSQEAFDIILRDRMGNPLLVANLNDSREAATEGMMEDLITAAERVGQSAEQFAGAFLVTRSFFDPGALEVAEESTQGGLLSRDKRKSFVNLSRKRGYHLCLVEARNENFHLAVPEL